MNEVTGWTSEQVIKLFLTTNYSAKEGDAQKLIVALSNNGYLISRFASNRLRDIENHAKLVLQMWDGSGAGIAWPLADALANLREALEEK